MRCLARLESAIQSSIELNFLIDLGIIFDRNYYVRSKCICVFDTILWSKMGRQLFLFVFRQPFTDDFTNVKNWSELSILRHIYRSCNLPFDHRLDSFGKNYYQSCWRIQISDLQNYCQYNNNTPKILNRLSRKGMSLE